MKPVYLQRSRFFQEKFALTDNQFLILQFGHISKDRFTIELTEIAQQFPSDWRLILHGCCGFEAVVKEIQKKDIHQKTLLSLERLPDSQLQEMVASAHIGLVLYPSQPLNDQLTSRSSEKLALYLQCGIPVIAFRYPGYELLEDCGCGVLINTLDELPEAIQHILSSYKKYHGHAYECFMQYYEFTKNFKKVTEFIESL